MENPKVTFPEVKLVIRCKHEGYAFDLESEVFADEIPDLIQHLVKVGIEPGNSPYLWDGQAEARSRKAAPSGAPKYETSAADYQPSPSRQPSRPAPTSAPKVTGGATEKQVRAIYGIARGVGFNERDEILRYCMDLTNRHLEKVEELSQQEASNVISALREFE